MDSELSSDRKPDPPPDPPAWSPKRAPSPPSPSATTPKRSTNPIAAPRKKYGNRFTIDDNEDAAASEGEDKEDGDVGGKESGIMFVGRRGWGFDFCLVSFPPQFFFVCHFRRRRRAHILLSPSSTVTPLVANSFLRCWLVDGLGCTMFVGRRGLVDFCMVSFPPQFFFVCHFRRRRRAHILLSPLRRQ